MRSTNKNSGSSPNAGNKKSVRITGGYSSDQIKSIVANSSGGNMRDGIVRSHGGGLSESNVAGDDAISILSKISLLEKDLERRQLSYNTREEAYQERIAQLEEELINQGAEKPGWAKADANISKLKAIQGEILNSIELVQDRTARIMQEQERDLLRSFRARLFDVQTELEKEKSKKDDGLTAWKERHAQLSAELSWATEVAQRLDKVNVNLLQENSQLKAKFVSQEEDRNFFVKKLVAVKKENALLRAQNTEIQLETQQLEAKVRLLPPLCSHVICSEPYTATFISYSVQIAELAEETSGHAPSSLPVSPTKPGGGVAVSQLQQQQIAAKNESEEK